MNGSRVNRLGRGAAGAAIVIGLLLAACAPAGREALPPAATPSAQPTSDPTETGEPKDPETSGPPPATTPVPPPTTDDGGIRNRVERKSTKARQPVALNKTAEVEDGVTVRIEQTEAIDAEATLPGEIAGPAVVFDLVAENQTKEPIDLVAVVVECADATGAPCGRISSDPAKPFTGTLEPGGTAEGRYVFVLPKKQRKNVTLTVTLTGDRPAVTFKGRIR